MELLLEDLRKSGHVREFGTFGDRKSQKVKELENEKIMETLGYAFVAIEDYRLEKICCTAMSFKLAYLGLLFSI